MALQQKLMEDLKAAMKSGDQTTLSVLRMAMAAINNKKIEKKGKNLPEELTDEEILDLLSKELKKRKEAINLYKTGGREDLAANEEKEAKILEKYLPKQLGREEIEQIILKLNFHNLNFGEAMKIALAELKGKADSKIIAEIIKAKL